MSLLVTLACMWSLWCWWLTGTAHHKYTSVHVQLQHVVGGGGLELGTMEVETLRLFRSSSTTEIRSNCWFKLKKRYAQSVISSKVAWVCVLWTALMNCVGIVTWVQWYALSGIKQLQTSFGNVVLIQSIAWFLYPVYGYMGERWTRYHVIMVGILVTTGGSILIAIFLSFLDSDQQLINHIVLFLGSIIIDIIDYVDQIRHTSSQTLVTLVRWLVFNNWVVFYALSSTVTNNAYTLSITKYVFIAVAYVLCALCFLIGIFFKSHFVIEPPPSIDPLKLIICVLK